jgi:3'(2'), 5'-bisphosphate nucleotidase
LPILDAAACAELMDALTAIAAQAAHLVGRFKAAALRRKADGSPVTAADEAAEAAICDGLRRLVPALPIVSEERTERQRTAIEDTSYFLVDPLDGTREFIAGRDEYAINIALLTNRVPILGIIAGPALGLIWRGIVGRGAERLALSANGKWSSPRAIRTRKPTPHQLIALVSRSHIEARTQAFLDGFPRARRIACGSALKFCRIAEGAADLYPRLAPTHDWDIAAGQAIVEAAGGHVLAPDGKPIRYGTPELIIPAFIAWGNAEGGPVLPAP